MKRPVLVDDTLLLLGQPHTKPSHDAPPCIPTSAAWTSLPPGSQIYHNLPNRESRIPVRAKYKRVRRANINRMEASGYRRLRVVRSSADGLVQHPFHG